MVKRDTVVVTGSGASPMEPDVLVVQLGVELTEGTPADALDRCAAALALVRAAVLGAGVLGEQLQTSRMSLEPEWEHHGSRPRVTGYTARIGLALTMTEAHRLGELLSAAVGAGGDAARVHSLSWGIDDSVAADRLAREAAFADARRRAEEYAGLAGRTLARVLSIVEAGREEPGWSGDRFVALAASSHMDVDPGLARVARWVRVTWELQ